MLYGSAAPYAPLLHEHLTAAGIEVNGPGVPRAARARQGWTGPAAVFRFLAGAPIRGLAGGLVPTSRWERISRTAGVVGGDDWDDRLERYAVEERSRAASERSEEASRDGLIARSERNAEAADGLRDFVASLRRRLDDGSRTTGWTALASWGLDAFHALLGEGADHQRLSEEERRAAERVERTLAGLVGLDSVEPGADLATLRDVVELQLADDLPRAGRLGTGVLVAPLSAAVGLQADGLIVAEAALPPQLR